ncbi:hypothetical protein J437_LFUL006299 [Ladona fulva]|uniref:Uncharacterized protein n=1 Tax=Ladona fulva TaxID=123851 RepID=A0A8K0NW69_LADFU|nr:hypothetical protein J437_LFUL006299 [Ladona fulva]
MCASNKGSDIAVFGTNNENTNDEVTRYLGGYISSNESLWRKRWIPRFQLPSVASSTDVDVYQETSESGGRERKLKAKSDPGMTDIMGIHNLNPDVKGLMDGNLKNKSSRTV